MSGTGTAANVMTKVGRNDLCPCGSGKKFKHCCQPRGAGDGRGSALSPAPRQRLQALFLAAKTHWDAGRLADTIHALQEITRLDPNSPQAHHDLGVAYLRLGRTADAAATLQRAVELRPAFHAALRYLASVLEQEGREPEAFDAYRKLSSTADGALERRHYSAKALAMEGKLDEAEKETPPRARCGPSKCRNASSPRGASVRPWNVRGSPAPSERGHTCRLPAVGRSETYYGGRPPPS